MTAAAQKARKTCDRVTSYVVLAGVCRQMVHY